MSSLPVGVVIIGAGRWGMHLLRNFLQNPRSHVVAVADPVAERLDAVRSQFKLDRTLLLSDWKAAMTRFAAEAVAIATPAATHYSLIQFALQHNLHVFAEKPLTLNSQQALELCQLAQQQQRQIVVDHTYLFHTAVQQGKLQIQQGQLGSLRYGYAARTHLAPVRRDTNVLWDLAVHDLTIFNHWLGETPQQVAAEGRVWLQPPQANFSQELADLVTIKLSYRNGFQALLHLCWCNPDKQRRLCFVGSQGTLIFDEMQPTTPLVFQQGSIEWGTQTWAAAATNRVVLPIVPIEPLERVCNHFLDCALQNTPSALASGWAAAEVIKILEAMTRSLQQGQPVTIEL